MAEWLDGCRTAHSNMSDAEHRSLGGCWERDGWRGEKHWGKLTVSRVWFDGEE
jgi:hypothetical protein